MLPGARINIFECSHLIIHARTISRRSHLCICRQLAPAMFEADAFQFTGSTTKLYALFFNDL